MLTVALSVTAVHTTAAAGPADEPRPKYGSEQVPTGVTPPPPKSGFAGDVEDAPTIRATAQSFGRVAARNGIGLRTYVVSEEFGNARTLDVYTPRQLRGKKGRKGPTVILVHGGDWQKGDRADLERHAVDLARLGFVVVSVNYRLATEAPWPAQRDDVNASIRYIRQNAKQLNVDNKRTVLIGSSAGGQIAANVATYGSGKKRFRGLVTLSGLISPLYMAKKDPSYSNSVITSMLLRCPLGECREQYRDASAVTLLDRKDPPALLFHSLKEKPWGPQQAKDFARAGRLRGVPVQLEILPGRQHGIDTWTKIFPTLREWLLQRLGTKSR